MESAAYDNGPHRPAARRRCDTIPCRKARRNLRDGSSPSPFVYFVQTHRSPAQVARLVRTLRRSSPTARIVVGHDGRGCRLTRGDLPEDPRIDLFAVHGPVERGELSLLAPYFEAIGRLAESGVEYAWLIYLSGQDYPTQPLGRSEPFLLDSGADGFLRHWDAFSPENPWGRRHQGRLRYAYAYRRVPAPLALALLPFNGLQRIAHVHRTYGPRLGLRCRRTPFSSSFVCYAGTQWTSLSRGAVEYLAATVRERRDLFAHYERTICPDESLIQTVLVNARRFRLVDDDLRYVDMRGSRNGSPRILGVADLPELGSGRYQFARKFDSEVDAAVLDRLDERIFA